MIPSFTQEELQEINKMLQRERGSKGGKAWWASLDDEQKEERKRKLLEGQKRKMKQNIKPL